jgi:hypothetical protein
MATLSEGLIDMAKNKHIRILIAYILLTVDLLSYVPAILAKSTAVFWSVAYSTTNYENFAIICLRLIYKLRVFDVPLIFSPLAMLVIDIAISLYGFRTATRQIKADAKYKKKLIALLIISIVNIVVAVVVLLRFNYMP